MDIHAQGGGIHYTVNRVRQATPDDLYHSLVPRLSSMMRYGTTTAEAKTGYGLDLESEVKVLRVLERARGEHPILNLIGDLYIVGLMQCPGNKGWITVLLRVVSIGCL